MRQGTWMQGTSMQQGAMSLRRVMRPVPGEVPAQVRLQVGFLGKFVLEVLPVALASVIGAFLFAHYQFGEPDMASPAAASATEAVPASAAMMQLVSQEHAMIRDFLMAEQAAEEKRAAAANAADANAVADAKIAAAARQALLTEIVEKPVAEIADKSVAAKLVAEKPMAKHAKGAVIANAAAGRGSVPAAQLPPVVIAATSQDLTLMPAPPPPPRISFVSRTLAMPGHVMAATLHAVISIGGIPSWIGHHVGASELDTGAPAPGAAS
jgi:hypothetical protein